ncbi:MAG: hypothetical protein ACR2OB_08835 [Solirubrobacteraceae bacterium]
MVYKMLGFVVWQGGKWYARRRFRGAGQDLALAAVTAVVAFGVIAAQRRSASAR